LRTAELGRAILQAEAERRQAENADLFRAVVMCDEERLVPPVERASTMGFV
jgi:hypothetical protein